MAKRKTTAAKRAPATQKAAEKLARQYAMFQERFARMRASYESAKTTEYLQNVWANADAYDADSANSKSVRETLVKRSRYEQNNNGYSDGIAQTYSTDLVGPTGPTLRMQSGSHGFNQMVEFQWSLWCKAIKFRRKLWCMAMAKHGDGEGFGVIRRNPKVKHPIPLDVCLYETEQFQTPYLPYAEKGRIDGIRFDEFGNPTVYELLHEHPGATGYSTISQTPEQIQAEFVLHWFKLRRPGQHRAVPECASTLNVGAASRRWRESTLSAADRAAMLTLMMETPMSPDEADAVAPFTTMDVEKDFMTFLPMGWKPNQLEGKFPTTNHEAFNKTLIGEQARPKAMPYNRAAADSSGHNFASGKLDFMPYFAALEVDREDCNDLVLDPLFDQWFAFAVRRFNWLGGNPEAVGPAARLHSWDWPVLSNADQEAEANANKTKLQSGQITLADLYSEQGQDLEDKIVEMATTFGVPDTEIRKRLLDIVLPPVVQGGTGTAGDKPKTPDEAVAAALRTLLGRRELLGATNGN
jgi:capsid protein